jgi:hypothetical protein
MGTGSRKQPSSSSGGGRGRSGGTPPALTELLIHQGAPWRPFEDDGVLIRAQTTPRPAAALFAACERALLSHLRAVCDWPEKERNRRWRIGDYAFYILEFSPAPKTDVYVQFWSEPDTDGVIFEVCSGALDPAVARFMNPVRREALRDHGFEVGGNAENFAKTVTVDTPREARAVARETLAVLCQALGYDGRQDLRYRLHLGSTTELKHVFDSIEAEELVSLLREWGFVATLKPVAPDRPPLIECRTEAGPFGVLLLDETKAGSESYQAIGLRTFHSLPEGEDAETAPALRHAVANQLNTLFSGLQASVDGDGDLVLEAVVTLYGGVTAEHLRARFEHWRGAVRAVGEAMR